MGELSDYHGGLTLSERDQEGRETEGNGLRLQWGSKENSARPLGTPQTKVTGNPSPSLG